MSLYTFEEHDSVRGARYTSTLRRVRSLGDLQGNEERLLRRPLEGHEAQFGAEHILALRITHILGDLYKEGNRFIEAAELLVRAHEGCKKVLGAEHPLTLRTTHSLGCLYMNTSNFEEARNILARATATYNSVSNSEDEPTLGILESLGVLYRERGFLQKAERVYEKLLKFKKALGADHNSRLNTYYDPGITYLYQGKFDEVEKIAQQIRRIFKTVPSKNIRVVLKIAYNLGKIYKERGEQIKAENLYRQVLSESGCSAFQYTPLDAESHFRVVSIKNGSWGEPRDYRITEYDLNDAPSYTALSYTWGDPNQTLPIILNNETIGITQNLYEFLQ